MESNKKQQGGGTPFSIDALFGPLNFIHDAVLNGGVNTEQLDLSGLESGDFTFDDLVQSIGDTNPLLQRAFDNDNPEEFLNTQRQNIAFNQNRNLGNQINELGENLNSSNATETSRQIEALKQQQLGVFNDNANANNLVNQFDSLKNLFGSLLPFKEGGFISKNKFNSIKKEYAELRKGGNVNTTGFTPGTDSFNNDFNIIPSNIITMESTPFDVLAITDKGDKRILKANSGTHELDGTRTLEIPLRGKNNKMKKDIFQLGGFTQFVPIQAEKRNGVREAIATQEGLIFSTNADIKHDDMEADFITDLTKDGSYVYSSDEVTTITKKEAEDISFGYEPVKYEEGVHGQVPDEILLSLIFDEEEMLPSELAYRIEDLFPRTKREDDAFADFARDENTLSRIPRLQALSYLNDQKRNKNAAPTIEELEAQILQKGGPVRPTFRLMSINPNENNSPNFLGQGQIPQVQLGSILGAGVNFVGGIMQRNAANKRFRENSALINQGASTQTNLANQSAGIGLLGVLGQNPVVQSPQFDNTFLNSLPTEVPNTVNDRLSDRINVGDRALVENVFSNSSDFSRSIGALSNLGLGQARTNALAEQALQQEIANIELQRDFLTRQDTRANEQIIANTQAENATTSNQNQLVQGAANVGVGRQNNLQQIEANRVTNTLGASAEQAVSTQQAFQNQINAINSALGAIDFTSGSTTSPTTIEIRNRQAGVNNEARIDQINRDLNNRNNNLESTPPALREIELPSVGERRVVDGVLYEYVGDSWKKVG